MPSFRFSSTGAVKSFDQLDLSYSRFGWLDDDWSVFPLGVTYYRNSGTQPVYLGTIGSPGSNPSAIITMVRLKLGDSLENAVFSGLYIPVTQYNAFDNGAIDNLWDYVLAGNDEITIDGEVWRAFGDRASYTIASSTVCGSDSLRLLAGSKAAGSGDGQRGIFGDIVTVSGAVSVRFGDDVIDARLAGSGFLLVGDTANTVESSQVIYGDDLVRGTDFNDSIHGDFIDAVDGKGGDDTLYGFAGDDSIYGGGGNDRVDGGVGNDTMHGGTGDDIYFVDSVSDVLVEISNEADGGYDRVFSSVNWTLGADFERLQLLGSANIDGIGNDLNNIIVGNAGRNMLDGRTGQDRLYGLGGNDTFVIDDYDDIVVEYAGEGADTVEAWASYVLGANVERLDLMGTANLRGTGNTLANVIIGNAGLNTISGLDGNDRLFGKLGNDTLTGGGGRDSFYFDTALSATSNLDRITDFKVVDDSIFLSKSVFATLGAASETGTRLASNAFKTIGVTGATIDADDRVIYDKATGKLYYDSNGLGSSNGGMVQFATLSKSLAMTYADFFVTL